MLTAHHLALHERLMTLPKKHRLLAQTLLSEAQVKAVLRKAKTKKTAQDLLQAAIDAELHRVCAVEFDVPSNN